ncbi:oxidoreductase molybdopterin binding protein [Haloterrigena turkmenica DSM 5511]|uniref:Oxidoreductase molybdopterin binding protein n=1 Tax=Haloterrigena turkmenica (strain ATCC 51198 / DSM 5511 / JCM 9101 / NCIMB 13204 / VKM B-1734 / 4k) TaxID=543526 RepID=D2RVJ4_HALTV|nr:molybdopterin-dependent oxidoreductase [Haloterrigena turkmenica]ADB59358.1 oxidoreductase molybdopterin binding protein [Haloterrigena turkmenica DSM 5511]
MSTEQSRESRREEIDAILERKDGGVRETRDEADKYTVVGAADRRTYANWLTPVEEHFVCHRNDIPDADADSWTVSLTGRLDDEYSLSDLNDEFPTVAVAHTMECAGNGRGQHRPETGSVQWGFEAAGTAIWTGTPLSSILRGRLDDADGDAWLTAVGGDPSDGDDVFARSIPLSKALEDCILATEMNGRPLPREHGFPVRLIVPGWYGVNCVKWVEELRLMDTMVVDGSLDRPGDHAYWQQEAYRMHPADVDPEPNETVETVDTWGQLEAGEPDHPYTFDQTVMSVIGAPDGESTVTAPEDGTIELTGVAWAGDDGVERVEVSTDGGDTWADAELFGPDYAGAWRLFRYDWDARPGTHVLCSRATDDQGRRQPMRISNPDAWRDALEADEFPWNEGGYAANAVLPNAVEIDVESA